MSYAQDLPDGNYRIIEPVKYASLPFEPNIAVVRSHAIYGFRSDKHMVIVIPKEVISPHLELEVAPLEIGQFIPLGIAHHDG